MKKEKHFRSAINLTIVVLLAVPGLVCGQATSASQDGPYAEKRNSLRRFEAQASEISETVNAREQRLNLLYGYLDTGRSSVPEPDGECDDLSGKWRITTSEGDSTWELSKNGPMYEARESGTGARGLAALMKENVLRLQFEVRTREGERYGGTYKCKLDGNCQASLSPCKLTYDFNRTGSYEAMIKRQ